MVLRDMISIISPTYNCAAYLKRCYQCIYNQTFEDWEWVIVNDGSTDESFSIINEICLNDSRVKYYELSENKGRGFARNFALNKALGDIVVVWDVDDLYTSNRLMEVYNAIKSGYDFFCSYALLVDNSLNLKGARHFYSKSKIIPSFVHATLGFKKSILDSNNLSYDVGMRAGEDLDIMLNLQSNFLGYYCEKYLMIYVEDREVNLSKAISANYNQFKTVKKFLLNNTSFRAMEKFKILLKFYFKLCVLNLLRISPKIYLNTVKYRYSEHIVSNKLNAEILILLSGKK